MSIIDVKCYFYAYIISTSGHYIKTVFIGQVKFYDKIFVCSRQYSVDYKLETYMKIARLYLEDDDPVQAEAYINRASLLQVRFG